MKNVVILGGAYAGTHAFQMLSQGLGEGFRVIMIDRNTHANHLYTFARHAVLPGHEHKAFVPYKGVLHPIKASDPNPPPDPLHIILHAKIIDLAPHEVTIDRTFPEFGFDSPVISFEYALYALGSRLPAAIDFWSGDANSIVKQPFPGKKPEDVEEKEYDGTKAQGIEWFKRCQERIRVARSVLCVGGGALGIQFATDIKSVYPEKQVMLLHSRQRLLPRFNDELYREVLKSIEDLGIELILGERLDLESMRPEKIKFNDRGQRVIRTEKGREIGADLILLCTGQPPNTELLAKMSPKSVDPKTKYAHVLRTMQLGTIPEQSESETQKRISTLESGLSQLDLSRGSELSSTNSPDETKRQVQAKERDVVEKQPETPFPHIFVAGDCADAFGAIKAGHTAYWQAEVASRNIIRLAQKAERNEAKQKCDTQSREGKQELGEEKGSLELEAYTPGPPAIKVSLGVGRTSAYQINGMVGRKDTPEADDLDSALAWTIFGILDAKPEDMFA